MQNSINREENKWDLCCKELSKIAFSFTLCFLIIYLIFNYYNNYK